MLIVAIAGLLPLVACGGAPAASRLEDAATATATSSFAFKTQIVTPAERLGLHGWFEPPDKLHLVVEAAAGDSTRRNPDESIYAGNRLLVRHPFDDGFDELPRTTDPPHDPRLVLELVAHEASDVSGEGNAIQFSVVASAVKRFLRVDTESPATGTAVLLGEHVVEVEIRVYADDVGQLRWTFSDVGSTKVTIPEPRGVRG
jgi:hypothetical protein